MTNSFVMLFYYRTLPHVLVVQSRATKSLFNFLYSKQCKISSQVKVLWSSGMTSRCGRASPGSIPGSAIVFFLFLYYFVPHVLRMENAVFIPKSTAKHNGPYLVRVDKLPHGNPTQQLAGTGTIPHRARCDYDQQSKQPALFLAAR